MRGRSTVIGRSSARDTPPNSLTDDDSVESGLLPARRSGNRWHGLPAVDIQLASLVAPPPARGKRSPSTSHGPRECEKPLGVVCGRQTMLGSVTAAPTSALCRRHGRDAVMRFDDDFEGIVRCIDPTSVCVGTAASRTLACRVSRFSPPVDLAASGNGCAGWHPVTRGRTFPVRRQVPRCNRSCLPRGRVTHCVWQRHRRPARGWSDTPDSRRRRPRRRTRERSPASRTRHSRDRLAYNSIFRDHAIILVITAGRGPAGVGAVAAPIPTANCSGRWRATTPTFTRHSGRSTPQFHRGSRVTQAGSATAAPAGHCCSAVERGLVEFGMHPDGIVRRRPLCSESRELCTTARRIAVRCTSVHRRQVSGIGPAAPSPTEVGNASDYRHRGEHTVGRDKRPSQRDRRSRAPKRHSFCARPPLAHDVVVSVPPLARPLRVRLPTWWSAGRVARPRAGPYRAAPSEPGPRRLPSTSH